MRLVGLVIAAFLTGCSGQLDHLGQPPTVTAPGLSIAAVPPPSPERMALVPAPPPPAPVATTGSLWRSGPSSLFGDRRARRRGDILTVVVEIDDQGEISNSTTRTRTGSDDVTVNALLGLPTIADTVLPGINSISPAISTDSNSSYAGNGGVEREEDITFRIAATVEKVLSNGHLVIRGSQEVRINAELRDLQLAGIVRPEDISRQNVITADKIADARIIYGGRGQLSSLQQPRFGQQIVDTISPF
ncbi:MAG: flagellar basal body L-ring protein FlgH [Paracoccaceae bacterium]